MAKNSKSNCLPKRIAGVKVPKSVRKGPIADALASPDGQAVVAEIMTAAAAAAKRAKDSSVHRDTLADMADRLRTAGDGSDKSGAADARTAAVAFAMAEAARAFENALTRRREAEEEANAGPSAEGWTEASEAVESKKKPPSYEGVAH